MIVKPWLKMLLWWAGTGGLLMLVASLWVRMAPESGGIRLAGLANPFLNWHVEAILNLFGNERLCFGPSGPLTLLAEALLILVTAFEWAVAGLLFNLALITLCKRGFLNRRLMSGV